MGEGKRRTVSFSCGADMGPRLRLPEDGYGFYRSADFRVFQVYGGSAGAAACNIYL